MPNLTNLATNTTLNAKINEVKYLALLTPTNATNASLNSKINEVKNKVPNITNLAITVDLTAAENTKY